MLSSTVILCCRNSAVWIRWNRNWNISRNGKFLKKCPWQDWRRGKAHTSKEVWTTKKWSLEMPFCIYGKKHAQTMLSQQTVPLVKMGTHTIYSYNRYIGSNLTNTLFKDARLKPSRNFTIWISWNTIWRILRKYCRCCQIQ